MATKQKGTPFPGFTAKCDTCGPLESFLIHGYDIRDRQLEDVWFDVNVATGKVTPANPADKDYLSDFNLPKIYKEVVEFAKQADVVDCPKCREDIDGPDTPQSPSSGITIPLIVPTDLRQLFGKKKD